MVLFLLVTHVNLVRHDQMLENMFLGNEQGNLDRLLDFSTAQTGTLFFVPTVDFLDGLGDE